MAVFTQGIVDNLSDTRVAEYLYELNENLTYMFNNLTPEDNYSEDARLLYVQRGKRIGSLEVRADKIEMRVADDERNYNTSVSLLADLLKLSATTPEGSSTLAMTGDKIELRTGKFIVNSTNLKLDAQGNAEFSGTVKAASIISSTMTSSTVSATSISASDISGGTITGTTISGGTITGTSINGGDTIRFKARPGYLQFGDFEVDDSYGRHIFQSYDEVTGMSTGDASGGELLLWAGWDGSEAYLEVNANGGTHCNGNFYYNGRELSSLIHDICESMIDDDDDPPSGDGDGELVDPGV